MRLIVDGHLDLAWNGLGWDRDLRRPLQELRAAESSYSDHPARGRSTVCLPEMRRGRVAVCLATVLVRHKLDSTPRLRRSDLDYRNPLATSAVAAGQLAYYRLLEQLGEVRILRRRSELEDHRRASASVTEPSQLPVGIVLSMEGADPIAAPAELASWVEQGLRFIGLTHFGPGRYGAGTGAEGGLNLAGIQLLDEMHALKVTLDVTHLTDRGFEEALDRFPGRVVASHHNCRALVPGQRQLSDEQLHRLIRRGAVIGAALDAWMLQPGWVIGQTEPASITFDAVADHIDHVTQLAGSPRHAAIGSDLDGGFGQEQTVRDLNSIADLQQLAEPLARRGYRDEDIDLIFHGNLLRVLSEALPP